MEVVSAVGKISACQQGGARLNPLPSRGLNFRRLSFNLSSLRAGSFISGRKRENKEGKKRGGGEKMSLHGSHCIQRASVVKNDAAI